MVMAWRHRSGSALVATYAAARAPVVSDDERILVAVQAFVQGRRVVGQRDELVVVRLRKRRRRVATKEGHHHVVPASAKYGASWRNV